MVADGTLELGALALPARWRRTQRWKNTAIYYSVMIAVALLRRLPLAWLRPLALLLGWLAWLLAGSERRRALQHMAAALPEKSAAERRRTVRRMFLHLAVSGAEMLRLHELLDDPTRVHLAPDSQAALESALAEGRGVVMASGHLGNWELMGQSLVHRGYPMAAIARPTYDPRLTRWLYRERTARGLRLIWRGGTGAVREMLRVFRDGEMLTLFIDQDTQVQGVFVPFFGRLAHTPAGAAALSVRHGAPLVVAWIYRRGTVHHIHIERCDIPLTGEQQADTLALTAAVTQKLEIAIRESPEQWVWMHRRWRTQPPAAANPSA